MPNKCSVQCDDIFSKTRGCDLYKPVVGNDDDRITHLCTTGSVVTPGCFKAFCFVSLSMWHVPCFNVVATLVELYNGRNRCELVANKRSIH